MRLLNTSAMSERTRIRAHFTSLRFAQKNAGEAKLAVIERKILEAQSKCQLDIAQLYVEDQACEATWGQMAEEARLQQVHGRTLHDIYMKRSVEENKYWEDFNKSRADEELKIVDMHLRWIAFGEADNMASTIASRRAELKQKATHEGLRQIESTEETSSNTTELQLQTDIASHQRNYTTSPNVLREKVEARNKRLEDLRVQLLDKKAAITLETATAQKSTDLEESKKTATFEQELSERKDFLQNLLGDMRQLSKSLLPTTTYRNPLVTALDANKNMLGMLRVSTQAPTNPFFFAQPPPRPAPPVAPFPSFSSFPSAANPSVASSPQFAGFGAAPSTFTPASGFGFGSRNAKQGKSFFWGGLEAEEAGRKQDAEEEKTETARKADAKQRKMKEEMEAKRKRDPLFEFRAERIKKHEDNWAVLPKSLNRSFEQVSWPIFGSIFIEYDRKQIIAYLTKPNIKEYIGFGIESSDHSQVKKKIMAEQLRYHSDKIPVWLPAILDADKQRVMEVCGVVSKILNEILEDSAKASCP